MTGQEELLMLRALVEKQKEELAAKDEIIARQNIRIENMVQALLQARKKLFGEQQKITVPSHTRKARQPGFRQEKDWYRLGLILSRSNMANWTNRCSEEWLTPIYERIHAELRACEVLHMDETWIQCNREDGKKASSDSYMWVIRSGACEHIQAVFFHYSPSRKREIAGQLLSGFQGYCVFWL